MNDLVIMERQNIVDIADALRNKTGVNDEMTLADMVTTINEIEAGGEELPSAEDAAFGIDSGEYESAIISATPQSSTMAQYTIGWQFKAAEPISVAGLRYYEGFNTSYPRVLRLWNSSGECLAEVLCPAQAVDAWTDIVYFDTPVNLGVDEIYTVSTCLKDLGAPIGSYYALKSKVIFNAKVIFQQPVYYATQYKNGFPNTYLNLSAGTPVPLVDMVIGSVSEPLPDNYKIARTTMDGIAEEMQRITNTENKMSVAQIQSGLESVVLQEKSITPTAVTQTVTPDSNYYGLSKVTVNPAQLQEKTITPTTDQQEIVPDSDYYGLSKVTVEAAAISVGLPSAEEGKF